MSWSPFATQAIARRISPALAACELEHQTRQAFDLDLAGRQHAAYLAALEKAGIKVQVLPAAAHLPDSNFVEDPVVMLDEIAVICRLARASRAPEAELIAPEIARVRPLRRIEAPGTLEGGDVLRVGRTLFVGLSRRTNQEGIEQLRRIVAPYDYQVMAVPVTGCLHLKTAVTAPGPGLMLVNGAWVEHSRFGDYEIMAVPADEPGGANTLWINGRIFVAASFPKTADLLRAKGLEVHCLDVSELQKAEAGLTCQSLLFK